MKTLYRTSFRVQDTLSPEQLVDRVADACFQWVFDPDPKKRPGLDRSLPRPQTAETIAQRSIGKALDLEALNASGDGQVAWGLRFCHPDSTEPDLLWSTDLGFYASEPDRADFTCSVSVSRASGSVAPIHRPSSRPRIVTTILNRFGGSGYFRLLGQAIALRPTKTEIERYIELLEDSHRTHPILFLSWRHDTAAPSVDAKKLADQLAGLAHVVVPADTNVTWLLGDFLPETLNCWGGSARLYWPGFKRSDSFERHPLWMAQDWSPRHATEQLSRLTLNAISEASIYNFNERVLTWDRLQGIGRQNAIREAHAKGNSNELLALFEEDNRSLNARVLRLEGDLALTADQLKQERYLKEHFREQLDKLKTESAPTPVRAPVTTVAEAIDRAKQDHPDRLAFAWNSKSEEKDCAFEDAPEVAQAFDWLATTYWLSKTNAQSCPDLDRSMRETIPGWTYSGHQSDVSVGGNKSWYECRWEGTKHDIHEHLRCGTSADPRKSLRIAFAWAPKQQKVVVGFLGQHQRNTKS